MKKLVKIIGIVLLVGLVIIAIGSVYMFNVALKADEDSKDYSKSYSFLDQREELTIWFDSLKNVGALRDTIILASDGFPLHALYVKSATSSPNTALLIHGYTDNAIRMMNFGHLYNKQLNYNILVPDLRGQGKTGGDYVQMGWKDRLDMKDWINASFQLFGDSLNMVVHGLSMGAATTMMLSGEGLPDNVKCFVEDCGYTSVWDEYKHELKKCYDLPPFPLLYGSSLYCQITQNWNFKEASSINQLKKNTKPMLFIHGEADTYVPTAMVYQLYEATQGEKELWTEPNVPHAKMYWHNPEKYEIKIEEFVTKYIPN